MGPLVHNKKAKHKYVSHTSHMLRVYERSCNSHQRAERVHVTDLRCVSAYNPEVGTRQVIRYGLSTRASRLRLDQHTGAGPTTGRPSS